MSARPSDACADDLPWVVWNGSAGLISTADLGRIQPGPDGPQAWLAPPFEMVGPFDLATLEREGRIAFAACWVMSRARWRSDQDGLREQARAERLAALERRRREQARAGGQGGPGWGSHGAWGGGGAGRGGDDPEAVRRHRATLQLPADGVLQPRQIRSAFRRLAQRAHPDVGGSHEAFIALKTARDALLADAD